ncbi:hypothetical protein [Haliea sp. E17]|uniref:hypothetical protein n=1 Tax=Haliea sp. E17 TaxID=3401576 RepID=UPI003AAF11D1
MRLISCSARGLLLAMTLIPALPVHAESRFERVVSSLAASEDQSLRARFASVAILELTETYLAEADLARRQARETEEADARTLRSWAGAVDRYAMQLLPLVETLEAGAPLAMQRHPNDVPFLDVAGRVVILAHPRPEQQAAYEQAVLARFCRPGVCEQLVAVDAIPLAPPPAPVNLNWEFGPGTAACVYRNLRVNFPGTANLNTRRELCGQLMRELEALASELARQPALGVAVEWDQLQVTALQGRPGHLVTLNRAGDSALVELPLLYASPGALQASSGWLRGRYNPAGPPAVSLSAAELGWE